MWPTWYVRPNVSQSISAIWEGGVATPEDDAGATVAIVTVSHNKNAISHKILSRQNNKRDQNIIPRNDVNMATNPAFSTQTRHTSFHFHWKLNQMKKKDLQSNQRVTI